MKEYDLFSSIGELDEKLLRRYGQEPTPTPQRRRWIRQLLTHAILLLLILGLIAWLLFCRRPAEPELNPPDQAQDSSEAGSSQAAAESSARFVEREDGTLIAPDGTEYVFLASEGILYHLGELEFVAYVEGEATENHHLGGSIQTGMFSIKDDPTDHLLIRELPNSEWRAIYRKASLPPFDFSLENCCRLEFVSYAELCDGRGKHVSCGCGITDPAEISAFLSTVRSQKRAKEAGLHNLVAQPDGTFHNCYISGAVCAFFEEEPYLAVLMSVTSYNDLAYSIRVARVDRVLPEDWFLRLLGDSGTGTGAVRIEIILPEDWFLQSQGDRDTGADG